MDTFRVTHKMHDVSIYPSLLIGKQQRQITSCASCVTRNAPYVYVTYFQQLIPLFARLFICPSKFLNTQPNS